MPCPHPAVRPARALLPGLALLMLLASAPAQAQWQWRDSQGRITISDLPPPREIPEQDVLRRPGMRPGVEPPRPATAPASAARPVAQTASAPAAAASASPTPAELQAARARLEAQRADNCARARRYLATLESGQRVARSNDKGEREVLDDNAVADEARRARRLIDTECR